MNIEVQKQELIEPKVFLIDYEIDDNDTYYIAKQSSRELINYNLIAREIDWFETKIYTKENSTNDDIMKRLCYLFEAVNYFFRENEFNWVNNILKYIDLEKCDLAIIEGLFRITCCAKKELPYWNTKFYLANKYLIGKYQPKYGEETRGKITKLFQGLK